jgi:hypothetical protein
VTIYRTPAAESGGPTQKNHPTEKNRSDGSRFWRYWQTLPGLIQALTPLVLGLAAGGAAGVTLSQHSSVPAPQPRATVTVTATPAPQPRATVTVSAGASAAAPQGGGLSLYSHEPVGITSNGINFDTNPPSSTPNGTIYYTGGLYPSTSNIEFAIWTSSGTPTAAQCQNWVTTHPGSQVSDVNPGMQVCIRTDQGRFGLLHIDAVDSTQVSATATIWGT